MKDNQHEQLFTELTAESEAPAFEELDNEKAAAIGGGAKIELYRDSNFGGFLGGYNTASARLSPAANDKTSSIKVNEGVWALYEYANFRGQSIMYAQGSHKIPSWFNDKTSSLGPFN
jgi:hypothetical protein